MQKKYKIIIGLVIIVGYVIYHNYQYNKFLSNDNMIVVKGQLLHYNWGKGYNRYGKIKYSYKGKEYISDSDVAIRGCYYVGQEMYIKMDTLNPDKIKCIPDTFITYYDVQRYGDDFFYDTFIAYDLKKYSTSIGFKLNIDGSIVEIEKLTNLKPKGNKMYYIVVNSYMSEGFLKNID
jgi:hypothetical protein